MLTWSVCVRTAILIANSKMKSAGPVNETASFILVAQDQTVTASYKVLQTMFLIYGVFAMNLGRVSNALSVVVQI